MHPALAGLPVVVNGGRVLVSHLAAAGDLAGLLALGHGFDLWKRPPANSLGLGGGFPLGRGGLLGRLALGRGGVGNGNQHGLALNAPGGHPEWREH